MRTNCGSWGWRRFVHPTAWRIGHCVSSQVMAMRQDDIAAAAATLVEARRAGTLLSELPAAVRPATIADGYAVQDAFVCQWGGSIAGWKIGATAKVIMDRFGLDEPFAGPFFAADVTASPARPAAADFPLLCIEAEFAFRFARPLPPRATPYTRADVVEAVGTVLPAYELVSPRFDRILFDQVPTVIGDCGLNAAFVLGKETTDWRKLDVASHRVRFMVDGKPKIEGSGAAVMGDPINVLVWTANHLSARGITLQAGQVVSTGASCGLIFLEPGETGVADFGSLGTIEIQFTGPKSSQVVKRG